MLSTRLNLRTSLGSHPTTAAGLSLLAASGAVLWLVTVSGCADQRDADCTEDACFGMPRIAVGVVPYDGGVDPYESAIITFQDSEGDIKNNEEDNPDRELLAAACSGETTFNLAEAGLFWTACAHSGPDVEWVDVTIAQDADRVATERVALADHNYCGRNIAYTIVTLHEDGPPTFGEVLYVSPCEQGQP